MSLLRRIEKSLDQRLRSIFSGGREEPGAREAIELYRDALDQIAAPRDGRQTRRPHISVQPDHDRTRMRPNAERKAVLETLFDPGPAGRRYPRDV